MKDEKNEKDEAEIKEGGLSQPLIIIKNGAIHNRD